MTKLMREMPYGISLPVQKIECTNHLLRNYCNKMRELVKKPRNVKGPVPMILRKHLGDNLLRLRTAITSAIKFRKLEDLPNSVEVLEKDIRNGPNHVFGEHGRCANYFCLGPKEGEVNLVPQMQVCGLWDDLLVLNANIARHSVSLMFNVTNNMAESYNACVAKYVGGKRVNFCVRRSYQTRCELAVTAYNAGPNLHSLLHKGLTQKSPGTFTKNYKTSAVKKSTARSKRRLEYKTRHKFQRPAGPDQDYGICSRLEDTEEVDEANRNEFLASLSMSRDHRLRLEAETRTQYLSLTWVSERRKRLTASLFGQICKLRANTCREKVAERILFPTFRGNKATSYGKAFEGNAVAQYEKISGNTVLPAGLFVDETLSFLAATPDGVLEDGKGIIEVKCPITCRDLSPSEAEGHKKLNFLQKSGENVTLKQKHNYHYQIQGQLRICDKTYCDFIVWSPLGIYIERINRNDHFWKHQMEQPLEKFYMEVLLPKILRLNTHKNE